MGLAAVTAASRMLYLVGLGLGDAKDITVKGLEVVRQCRRVYLEAYTSVLTVGKEALVGPGAGVGQSPEASPAKPEEGAGAGGPVTPAAETDSACSREKCVRDLHVLRKSFHHFVRTPERKINFPSRK